MSEGEKDGPRKKDWEQKDGGQKTRHDARIHPSPPPKQHVKAWALQITTSCSHFSLQPRLQAHFLQSHSRARAPSVLSSPSPSDIPLSARRHSLKTHIARSAIAPLTKKHCFVATPATPDQAGISTASFSPFSWSPHLAGHAHCALPPHLPPAPRDPSLTSLLPSYNPRSPHRQKQFPKITP